jgi:hypothetical protein
MTVITMKRLWRCLIGHRSRLARDRNRRRRRLISRPSATSSHGALALSPVSATQAATTITTAPCSTREALMTTALRDRTRNAHFFWHP